MVDTTVVFTINDGALTWFVPYFQSHGLEEPSSFPSVVVVACIICVRSDFSVIHTILIMIKRIVAYDDDELRLPRLLLHHCEAICQFAACNVRNESSTKGTQ
jgi:hypothetical protein